MFYILESESLFVRGGEAEHLQLHVAGLNIMGRLI